MLLDSVRLFLVFQRKADGKLLLPFHVAADPDDMPLTAVNQYLCGLGWDFSAPTCIGPWGIDLPDAYFHLLHDGASGWAPAGWTTTWMSMDQIGQALNEGRFIRAPLVDRAISLYTSHYLTR